MLFGGSAPGGLEVAATAVQTTRDGTEFLLHLVQLAKRNGQKTIRAERNPFFELQLLFELVAPETERGFRPRCEIGFKVIDVSLDGGRGFRGRICKVAEDVQIVERGESAREVNVDELEDAAPALESHLDEDARAFLDVVAGRLDKPRHLPQFRHDAAGAIGLGSVGEQRLSREARSDQVCVQLRIALPGAHFLEVEHPRFDIRGHDGMFNSLGWRERAWIDLMKTPAESG